MAEHRTSHRQTSPATKATIDARETIRKHYLKNKETFPKQRDLPIREGKGLEDHVTDLGIWARAREPGSMGSREICEIQRISEGMTWYISQEDFLCSQTVITSVINLSIYPVIGGSNLLTTLL